MPIIPATQEAEQENHFNPGGGGCGEPRSRHCTPVWATREKLHFKKKRFSLIRSYIIDILLYVHKDINTSILTTELFIIAKNSNSLNDDQQKVWLNQL